MRESGCARDRAGRSRALGLNTPPKSVHVFTQRTFTSPGPWPLSKVKNGDDVTWHLSAWFFSKMALDTLKANRSGGDFSEVTFFAPLLSLQLPILTRAALVFTLRRFLLLVLTEATVAQVLMVVVQV